MCDMLQTCVAQEKPLPTVRHFDGRSTGSVAGGPPGRELTDQRLSAKRKLLLFACEFGLAEGEVGSRGLARGAEALADPSCGMRYPWPLCGGPRDRVHLFAQLRQRLHHEHSN
jgi:hypothetical protein